MAKFTVDQILGRPSSNPSYNRNDDENILGRTPQLVNQTRLKVYEDITNLSKFKTSQEQYNVVQQARQLGLINKDTQLKYIQAIADTTQQQIKQEANAPFQVGPVSIPNWVVRTAAAPAKFVADITAPRPATPAPAPQPFDPIKNDPFLMEINKKPGSQRGYTSTGIPAVDIERKRQLELSKTVPQIEGLPVSQQNYLNNLSKNINTTTGQGLAEYNNAITKAKKIAEVSKEIQSSAVDIGLWINKYNAMGDNEQRDLRDKLSEIARDYSISSDNEMLNMSSNANSLLGIISAKPEDLQKEGLPAINNRMSLAGVAQDFGGGLVGGIADLAKMTFGGVAKITLGYDPWTANENDYKAGKIDKQTYEIQQSKLREELNRLIGQDNTPLDVALKSLGWGAFGGSFFIPGAAWLKGGGPVLKQIFGDIVANTILGGLGTLKDLDRDLTWKDYATNAGLGALMSSIPYFIKGSSAAYKSFKAGKKLSSSAADILSQIDSAATRPDAVQSTYESLSKIDDPAVLDEVLTAIKDELTPDEIAKLRENATNISNAAKNLETSPSVTAAVEETAPTTAITEAVTTPTTTQQITQAVEEAVAATTKETPIELQAKKQLSIEAVATKIDGKPAYNITDLDGNVLATVKAANLDIARMQLKKILADPVKYSKTYKNLFEPVTSVSPKTTKTKPTVAAPPKNTATFKDGVAIRPTFLPEGYAVLIKETKNAKGKVIQTAILRNANGEDVRTLTAAEMKRFDLWKKDRAQQTKLETAKTQLEIAAMRNKILTTEKARPSVVATTPLNAQDIRQIAPGFKPTKGSDYYLITKDNKPYGLQEITATGNRNTLYFIKKGILAVEAPAPKPVQKPTPVTPAATKPKNVTKAKIAGAKEMDKLKEAPVTPVPVKPAPAKPKVKEVNGVEGVEAVTAGGARTSASAVMNGIADYEEIAPATFKSLGEGKATELINKYIKDWETRPQYVLDVIDGRKIGTEEQLFLYPHIMEQSLQKGDFQTWFDITNTRNLASSPGFKKASEAGQKLSLISLIPKSGTLNEILERMYKDRFEAKKSQFKATGTSLEKTIKKNRDAIDSNIAIVTQEELSSLVAKYTKDKTKPLMKAINNETLVLKDFQNATSDMRIKMLEPIVGKELALKVASDFERTILQKNIKAGIIRWVMSNPRTPKHIRNDIIDQVSKNSQLFDPSNAGRFENLIETSIGLRFTSAETKRVFELSKEIDKAKEAALAPYKGDMNKYLEESIKKAKWSWKDGKFTKSGADWQRSVEDVNFGRAQAEMMLYLKDVQRKNWKQQLEEIETMVKAEPLKAIPGSIIKLNDLARGLQSAMDNSFLMRQGMMTLQTNPKIWWKGAMNSYGTFAKTFADPIEAEKAFMTYILSDPWSAVASKNGVALLKRDDIFQTSGPGNIKIIGRPYKASELAYDMAAQTMRLELYKTFFNQDMLRLQRINAKATEKYGAESELAKIEYNQDYPKHLARFVNSMTGRGYMGEGEKIAQTLNLFMFSARFARSQVDKFLMPFGVGVGGPWYKSNGRMIVNPVQRRAALKLLHMTANTAGILAIADYLQPGSVEWDPRSADFGKIKIGNTRFDITGGLGQYIVLSARTLPAILGGKVYTKNSNTGLITELNTGEYGSKTAWDVSLEFLQNKSSPYMTQVINQLRGVDINRLKPDAGSTLLKFITPMTVGNFWETLNDPNGANAFFSTVADFNGISSNTYAGAGMGTKGSSWEISMAKDIIAFKEKVGDAEFKKAAKKADDQFNTLMVNLMKKEDWRKADSQMKRDVIRMAASRIQKDIFNEYDFTYKQQRMTDLEKQIRENLIEENL